MGSIRKRDDVFTVMHGHSHDAEEKNVCILEMKHEMKRRAETSNEPLRRIFDEVCATAPEDAAVSISYIWFGSDSVFESWEIQFHGNT